MPPPSVSTSWWLSGVYFTSPSEGWAVGGDDSNHLGVLLLFGSPISPMGGTVGTEITFTGSGFGAKKGKVLLGTVGLKILSWSEDSILAQLLKPLSPGIYDVTVQPKESKGASPIVFHDSFSVRSPDIGSVEPQSGSANDQITIQGLFFGTKKGKVTLGGKSCKVLSWTMVPTTEVSEIRFVVPKRLNPGTHELIVTTTKVGSDTIDFTVD